MNLNINYKIYTNWIDLYEILKILKLNLVNHFIYVVIMKKALM